MTKSADFVIVGSGVGGLTTALILAKAGHSVIVLEKNHQVGGSLQVFSRDKTVFDTGVHYIGSLDSGENLHQFYQYLGILDDLKMKRLDDDCYDLIRFSDGKTYKHGQGYGNFQAGLQESFPDEAVAIQQFCIKIQEVCTLFPLYNLQTSSESSYFNNPEIMTVLAYDYIASITQNTRLQGVLAGSIPLFAGKKDKTPLYVLALILNSFIKGSYRMVDGGSQIAIALSKQIRAHGGEVLKHQEVIAANYNETGQITSVQTKTGDTFRANNFISNLHPNQTIQVFGENRFIGAYKNRIRGLENTISSFMVYIVFHENSFPYINYNIYNYTQLNPWDSIDYSDSNWPEMLYICTPTTSKSNHYADSLNAMAYMDYSEVAQWDETFNTVAQKGNRGAEYEAFKHKKELQVIDELEKIFPDIRSKIKSVYSSTPITYRDYIGTSDGSLYGILKDATNSLASTINPKTRISNLYLTGQNLVFHGILGATIGAFVTSFYFVDKERILEEINTLKQPIDENTI